MLLNVGRHFVKNKIIIKNKQKYIGVILISVGPFHVAEGRAGARQ
jgi:hypothetical protein